MNRISSQSTFFYKRVFPAIWFGFLAVFACLVPWQGCGQLPIGGLLFTYAVLVMMAVIGFVVMKRFVWDLVDEVWDCGDELLVRNKEIEERIPLTECINVNYQGLVNPPRVTLMLRNPSAFGSEVTFTPPFRVFSYSTPPLVRELIERVDAARSEFPRTDLPGD